MPKRKFIVTINAETDVDVYDIQDAVAGAQSNHVPYPARFGTEHVEVELVELTEPQTRPGQKVLRYNVIEAA